MRILPLQSNINISSPAMPKFCAARLKPAINKDIFIKDNTSDFLSLPTKEIFDRIRNSINKPQNKLGNGGEANVWKIENSNYCVRIPIDYTGKFTNSIKKTLTKNDKVNHVVAKLSGGVTIMPIIEGFTFCSDNINDSNLAKIVEKMPLEAYKNLINQIYKAETETDMVFDSGWKNIIINPVNNTMTAIDFYRPKERGTFSNQILSSIYASLANNPNTTFEQKQICAGKLLASTVQLKKDEKINLRTLGLTKLLRELKYQKVIENNNYIEIIKNSFEDLTSADVNKSTGAYRILTTLIKQLFNVTI